MNFAKTAFLALFVCLATATALNAQSPSCGCGDAICGCEAVVGCGAGPACGCEPACGVSGGCVGLGCESAITTGPACGCEPACGAGPSCAAGPACGFEPACGVDPCSGADPCGGSGCGGGSCLGDCCLGGGCFDCCLGEPCRLLGDCGNFSAGGWISLGYHDEANSLFNSYSEKYQLHQAWVWFEKSLDTSCGWDIGGRVDYLYGTDAPDTQAFGTGSGWDNDWDNGNQYGRAMPQAYLEVGYGDLSVKVGHFFTIIGWEVVPAPDNFFYSHAYTMYNNEPFTHTGALATYNLSEDISIWAGYTQGWDSGFDDNGDAFLGGATVTLTDRMTLIYAATGGRFGEARWINGGGDERGFMNSIILDYAVSDNLQYIFQHDLLDTENRFGNRVRERYAVNQYLIYTINDCWALGGRFEWWNRENGNSDSDVYDLTLGINYKPHANVTIRPEVRWDWDDDRIAGLEDNDDEQTTIGANTIITF